MAIPLTNYMPYDAGPGANVTEDGWRTFMRRMLNTSGVFRDQLNKFLTYGDSTGMKVKVKTGQCWIEGHYGEYTGGSDQELAIVSSHPTLARKDRVIIRNDFTANRMEFDVLTGTAAGSPVTPGLTQNSSRWEISLGIVNVPAAAVTISAGNVLDARHYNDAFPVFSYLNNDFTVTSNISPQPVPDLQWPLSADALYTIEGYMHYRATTASDARFQVVIPNGATGWWSGRNLDIGTAGFAGNFDGGAVPIGDLFGAGGAGIGVEVNSGVLGTIKTAEQASILQMKFAQTVSSTTGSVLGAGSWIRCTRIRPA